MSVASLGAVAMRRQRILRKFEEAGADRPERARTFAELGIRDRLLLSRMVQSGVLVKADGERYFLSAEGISRWNRRRNFYVLGVLGAVAILIVILKLFVDGR